MSLAAVRRAQESVPDQVKARIAVAVTEAVKQVFLRELGGSFKAAPLLNPPIPTGMTDTTDKLKAILTRRPGCAISQAEYQQVPTLLRRIRNLLRVYYNALLTGRKPVEFKYCDVDNIFEVGVDLHQCGLTLQLTPGRLRALFRYAPEMDVFLFGEPLDLGKWRAEAFARTEAVAADPESTDEDRMAAAELEMKADEDIAASLMSFFVGDVLVGWLLVTTLDDAEEHRAKRAAEKLVQYACSPLYRKGHALGDSLTDTMRAVYSTPSALVGFAHAGGLPALFDDWATSVGKDGYCKTAVETLPTNAWENQTPESLLGVARGLVEKVSADGDEVVTTKLFAKIIHQIYSRYGLAPFKQASTISDSCILFYFLHRRIARKPAAYKSYDAIRALLRRYPHLVKTTRRRHGWLILSIGDRWECIEQYGCAFENCPDKTELLELREQRQRGIRDPVVEERLYKWGGESKACKGCKTVSYCSVSCQKADLLNHKPNCKKADEMELEV